jgi:hypothetical protein
MFDNPAGISPRYDSRRDIFNHHTSGGDSGVIADSHSWTNDRTTPNPDIIANLNGSGEF